MHAAAHIYVPVMEGCLHAEYSKEERKRGMQRKQIKVACMLTSEDYPCMQRNESRACQGIK
jgi:hypothetical protein